MKKGERLRRGTLTTDERVLLHLREASPYRETLDAPMKLTQQGIAEATGVRVNHVSRAMKGLREKGLVVESNARVRGGVRRRKVYVLSPNGVETADAIREVALKRLISVDDGSGEAEEMSVARARKALGRTSVLEIAMLVDGSGVLTLGKMAEGLAAPPRRALVLDEMRLPGEFYDRTEELEHLREWLRDEAPTVQIVKGRAGMGKTSLAATLAQEASESMSVLWYDAGAWETPDAFLGAMASFMAQQGKEDLKGTLSGGRDAEAAELLGILRRDLAGLEGLLVFDDCAECPASVARFLGAVVEAATGDPSLRVLMTSDTGDVPMRRDLAASGRSSEMDLRGLDRETCRRIVGEDVDEVEFEKLYDLAEGHPLSFKLLTSGEVEDLVRGKDLTPEEAALVKYLALRKLT